MSSVTTDFVPGDVVETLYGVGVITKCINPVSQRRSGTAGDDDDVDCHTDDNDDDRSFQVWLWRAPGKSIGSSSIAYLRRDTLKKKLPVAPGMIATKVSMSELSSQQPQPKQNQQQRYMVLAYYSDKQLYRITPLVQLTLDDTNQDDNNKDNTGEFVDGTSRARRMSRMSVSRQFFSSSNMMLSPSSSSSSSPRKSQISASNYDNDNDDDTDEELVPISELQPAPSAKFYPLLVELMTRGDQAAAATQQFLQDDKVHTVIEKAGQYTHQQAGKALELAKQKIDDVSSLPSGSTNNLDVPAAETAIVNKVKDVAQNEQVVQLMEMLKTEDLTVLLEKGKERLEQLLHQDMPKATLLALEKTGIRIANDDDNDNDSGTDKKASSTKLSYKETIRQSRKAALVAIQKVMEAADVDPSDVQAIQQATGENFGSLLDHWTEVAKTDRTLNNLLETVNEQTAAWQEATGRLLNTRSASIFLDGASRIQARAKTLFSTEQLQWAGEVGSKFTKAFTEGDAAVARLKSIELGDQLRDRLVAAIEVRSESLGGLDGIIAGALTTMKSSSVAAAAAATTKNGDDQMKDMLTKLQSHATTFSKDANETLISVLAKQSEYRDVALLKVEQVLCDLDSEFGQELSPEDIASIAKGEGGTAKLFEPIAKRAAKEIERQLDAAESSVSDPTMLDVLKHVRKIVSGELTITAVLDEVVNILNDDKVVAAGENLVKQGEQVLDAIEGVNANKVVDDVLNIAERAGITKDKVMEGIEKLNVNELLDNAGNAITDEAARQKLLSDATDTALDFILRILPSMPVPPVEGVKDGLVYHISNLSMEGFKVKKENILVEIAGMRATKRASVPDIRSAYSVNKSSSSSSMDGSNRDGLQYGISSASSFDSTGMDYDTSVDENTVVKATELLIIDVREVAAVMNHVEWSFEQTYMPYLKGNGRFDVKMSDGAIRLVFELRKRRKESSDKSTGGYEWEPVLCLHDRSCSIGSVDFNMQGGSRLAWVINKIASVFKGLLRDYVVRTILRILTDKSGWMLSKLNQGLSPFWDVLLRTAKLEMGDLAQATRKDIVEATPVAQTRLVELVWRERLPLGMNLLLNDDSGLLKVVDFPRGSQARLVCEKRKLDPETFKGATVMAVNGIRYQTDDELFDALRDPARPKTIQFEIAESADAERIRKFVEDSDALYNPNAPKKAQAQAEDRVFATRTVQFVDPMELGIEFANSPDNAGLVVRKFLESDDGLVLAAARRNEDIHVGDFLTHVNGKLVVGENGTGRARALSLLEVEGSVRPLSLTFADPYLHTVANEQSTSQPYIIGGPDEIVLKEDKESKRILLDGFKDVDSASEKAGVMLGDYLVFLNGVSVGAGCRWMGEAFAPGLSQVYGMLQDVSNYPIGLTFARPLQDGDEATKRDWTTSLLGSAPEEAISLDNSETICVTADSYGQLGLSLELKSYSDIVVKDLLAISGPMQVSTEHLRDPHTDTYSHLSVEAVNGEFVPSFATTQMVKSAMDRSWKSEKRVEVTYCDNDMKEFIFGLKDH